MKSSLKGWFVRVDCKFEKVTTVRRIMEKRFTPIGYDGYEYKKLLKIFEVFVKLLEKFYLLNETCYYSN